MRVTSLLFFFFQAEDGIRDLVRSRGLGDVYKRQVITTAWKQFKEADLEKVKLYLKSPNIVDGRNLFDQKKMKDLGFNYVSVGR